MKRSLAAALAEINIIVNIMKMRWNEIARPILSATEHRTVKYYSERSVREQIKCIYVLLCSSQIPSVLIYNMVPHIL